MKSGIMTIDGIDFELPTEEDRKDENAYFLKVMQTLKQEYPFVYENEEFLTEEEFIQLHDKALHEYEQAIYSYAKKYFNLLLHTVLLDLDEKTKEELEASEEDFAESDEEVDDLTSTDDYDDYDEEPGVFRRAVGAFVHGLILPVKFLWTVVKLPVTVVRHPIQSFKAVVKAPFKLFSSAVKLPKKLISKIHQNKEVEDFDDFIDLEDEIISEEELLGSEESVKKTVKTPKRITEEELIQSEEKTHPVKKFFGKVKNFFMKKNDNQFAETQDMIVELAEQNEFLMKEIQSLKFMLKFSGNDYLENFHNYCVETAQKAVEEESQTIYNQEAKKNAEEVVSNLVIYGKPIDFQNVSRKATEKEHDSQYVEYLRFFNKPEIYDAILANEEEIDSISNKKSKKRGRR